MENSSEHANFIVSFLPPTQVTPLSNSASRRELLVLLWSQAPAVQMPAATNMTSQRSFFFLIYIVFGVEALSYVYWLSDVLFLKSNFIYLLLTALGLCCFARAFSSSESRGYSLVGACRLLIAVASLAV